MRRQRPISGLTGLGPRVRTDLAFWRREMLLDRSCRTALNFRLDFPADVLKAEEDWRRSAMFFEEKVAVGRNVLLNISSIGLCCCCWDDSLSVVRACQRVLPSGPLVAGPNEFRSIFSDILSGEEGEDSAACWLERTSRSRGTRAASSPRAITLALSAFL